jgi:hypothetical protein
MIRVRGQGAGIGALLAVETLAPGMTLILRPKLNLLLVDLVAYRCFSFIRGPASESAAKPRLGQQPCRSSWLLLGVRRGWLGIASDRLKDDCGWRNWSVS